ncbi:MAG: HD domain-containing protein, partial [Synergistaceae bacterium]|nr:HD domain-containing protein [Synergistaceae bacterium]
MATLERAIEIATKAHEGQTDRGGAPYIRHCLRVMERMATEEMKIAAVLHDVVEDTPVPLEDLRREGFSEAVVKAVDALTRREGEDYPIFIMRTACNHIG